MHAGESPGERVPNEQVPDGQPETAAAYFERAEALNSFGRPEAALEELQRGLGQFPDDGDLLGFKAWLLFFAGDLPRAEEFARSALAVRPGDARALNTLCEVAVADGRPLEGLEYARELQRAYPDWSVSHLQAAYALLADESGPRKARKARRAEAKQHIERALELAPEHVETLRRAAIMLSRVGDDQAASDVLDRALELDPTNEDLLLLAANREAAKTAGAQGLVGVGQSAGFQANALRLLSGVLAENPEHRGAARTISDEVWARTQLLATVAIWMLVALSLFAYLLFGEPMPGSQRSRVKFAEAVLVLPAAWFVLLFTIRRRGLPKRFMRRLYAPVWWVWIGYAFAALGGLGTILWALTLALRSGEKNLELQGSYVGGITMGVAFTAWLLMIAELLFVFARFASERRNRLFPADDEGVAAAKRELREALWGLVRVGFAVLLVFAPVFAAPIAMRPEAAQVFAPVAVALGLAPLVTLLLRFGRLVRLRATARQVAGGVTGGGSATVFSSVLFVAALALAAAGVVGGWLLADRHAAEHDPPPTPWELELREQQRELAELAEERREQREQLERAIQETPPLTPRETVEEFDRNLQQSLEEQGLPTD